MKAFMAVFLSVAMASGQEWVQQITSGQLSVQHMVIGRKGDCYLSGTVALQTNSPNFGPTNLQNGAFLARFDASGNLVWAQQTEAPLLLATAGDRVVGSDGQEIFQIGHDGTRHKHLALSGEHFSIVAVSASDQHSLVIAGSFQNHLRIGKRTLSAADTNGVEFVARITLAGRALWLNQFPPSGIRDLAATRQRGAYLLDFASRIRAFDRHGDTNWEVRPEGLGGYVAAISADPKGNCVVAGTMYEGRIQVGSNVLTGHPYWKQAFSYSISSNGEIYAGWIFGGFSYGWDIATDRKGNWWIPVFAFGRVSSLPQIETQEGDSFVFKNGESYFNGRFSFTQATGPGSDWIQRIATSRDGSIYIVGRSDPRFGSPNGPTYIGSLVLTNGGAFLAKFKGP